jgi:hypothetical protein
MTDTNQPPIQEQEPKKKNDRSIYYIIVIILLVLMVLFLYNKVRQGALTVSNQSLTINSDSAHIADLDARYHAEMDSLYSYKGQNATLDSLLKIKIHQLAGMESSLATAKKTNKLDEAEYQKNVDALNSMVGDLKNQIADLQKQNGILIQKNDSLGKSLEVSEGNNQQLTEQNASIGAKLTKASLLVPVNIMGEGVSVASNGKEKTTANNKKAKKIKVAFDIPANNTIDAGDKTFYLVLTDPKGNVLNDLSQGSGVFKIAETTNQQQYTASKTVSYNQQKQHVEIEWNSTTGFDVGSYTAEIYQDGYLTGKGTIKLK